MVARQFRWKIGIQFVYVGHTASPDKNVGIKGVDTHGQSACPAIDVPTPDQTSQPVSLPHFCNNFSSRQIRGSMPGVVRLERPPGDPGLEAAALTAVARLSRDLGEVGERQGIVSPFAGTVIRTVMCSPADGDASARAASQDHGEND